MKKILSVLLFLILAILVFFLFSLNNKKVEIKTSSEYHNWKEISTLLNEENYEKIWINPEKYKNFKDFLVEFKSFSWVNIDPISENFSIWIKKENWNIIYIPFDYKYINKPFEEDKNKNLAILDIYSAYKEWMVFWWSRSKSWEKIIFDDEINNHPETVELNKIFNRQENVNKYIESLEKTQNLPTSKKELLSYLYDFVWNYDKANEERENICKNNSNCSSIKSEIILTWKILDENWKPINWAKVELLNNPLVNYTTKQDWSYELKANSIPFSHLRIKASFEWYSDWFTTYALTKNTNEKQDFKLSSDITLNKYSEKITISQTNSESFKKWKYYVIKTEYSTYFVPTDWLFFEDWSNYSDENFDIYTYQFTKWSNMSNLLENDTFEPVFWYVWNIMKTFWMPYIQFIDKKTKKELFIKSSNPMILQNQIYHMKELYENYDKIYEAVTKEDMKKLYEYSQNNEWYPIDFDYLVKNNILRWPARWALDRKTWIWSNVWQKLLNETWLVELPFYSIKDNQ